MGSRPDACVKMRLTKLLPCLSSFFATFEGCRLVGSNSYLLCIFFSFPNKYFKRTINVSFFVKEHHSLTSRHKLLLNRDQRAAVSTQEGNARSA